jgi:hypothetical protein
MRSICFAFLIMMSNQASAWTEKVFDEFSETGQWGYVAGLTHAFQLYNELLRKENKSTLYCVPEEFLKDALPDAVYVNRLIKKLRNKLKKAGREDDYEIALLALVALQERFPCE